MLDPFVGTGTTPVVARQLGPRAVGIEVSERHCELAATRLAQGWSISDFEGPDVSPLCPRMCPLRAVTL